MLNLLKTKAAQLQKQVKDELAKHESLEIALDILNFLEEEGQAVLDKALKKLKPQPKPQLGQKKLVHYIVGKTADLGLDKEEVRLLPPYQGMWGCIAVTGNCLPVFIYTVYSDQHQGFVSVRVEISPPARIQYRAFIPLLDSHGSPRKDMFQEIEPEEEFKIPFQGFLSSIEGYFPLLGKDRDRVPLIMSGKVLPSKSFNDEGGEP